MKPITIHPASALIGVTFTLFIIALVGAAQAPGVVQRIPSHEVRVVGEVPAAWWTFAYVESGFSTFTVPADRHFVVTRCSSGGNIRVNGQPFQNGSSMMALEIGDLPQNETRVVIPPGSLIQGAPGGGACALWGYLEPVG